MPNESLIAVPLDVVQPNELRQFLVQLVIRLDKLLGFRGDDPAVTEGGITVTSEGIVEFVDESIEAIKYPEAIATIPIPDMTVAGPTIAEVQEIADDLLVTVKKVNELLAALKSTGIIQ